MPRYFLYDRDDDAISLKPVHARHVPYGSLQKAICDAKSHFEDEGGHVTIKTTDGKTILVINRLNNKSIPRFGKIKWKIVRWTNGGERREN